MNGLDAGRAEEAERAPERRYLDIFACLTMMKGQRGKYCTVG